MHVRDARKNTAKISYGEVIADKGTLHSEKMSPSDTILNLICAFKICRLIEDRQEYLKPHSICVV